MKARASGRSRTLGFTLMEMMVVMILLGILAGLGFAGFDKMDPGFRGLQVSLENFLEASRDRARGSGQDVRITLQPATEDSGARLGRSVYRAALEAGFEPAFANFENIQTAGGVRLGQPGRCGAGLDLREGGFATVEGRGGTVDATRGFALEFDLLNPDGAPGRVCSWEGLLELEFRRGAGLQLRLRAGEGELLSWVQLDIPSHFLRPGRWQHLRIAAAEGSLRLWLEGTLAGQETIGPMLGAPACL